MTMPVLTLTGTQLVPFLNKASVSFQDILQLALGQQHVRTRGLAIFHAHPGAHTCVFTIVCDDGMTTELPAGHRNPIQVRIMFPRLANK